LRGYGSNNIQRSANLIQSDVQIASFAVVSLYVNEALLQRIVSVVGRKLSLQFGTGARTNRLNRRSDDISSLLQEEVRLNVAADSQRDRR
jgi:hypothetical protein